MIIIGAGMSGLLAGQYFRSHDPIIIEKQDELPNNHKALLRFRSEAVSQLTGIKFKKVNVQKLISFGNYHITTPNLYFGNQYSMKVSGAIRGRSISNLDDCQRYIAPPDFISKVSKGLNIHYGNTASDILKARIETPTDKTPIISTMPIHLLAEMLDYDLGCELNSRPIWTFSFDLNMDIDVYQTVYYPDLRDKSYRMSITGNKVIVEFAEDICTLMTPSELYDQVCDLLERDFGFTYMGDAELTYTHQQYGKLVECDDSTVKDFICWASKNYNIYSLGRWGTHRQILMDDVVADLKVIDTIIETNGYKR